MNSKMLVFDLLNALRGKNDGESAVQGVINGKGFPIYSIDFFDDIVELSMLHKEPWPKAAKSASKIIDMLDGFTRTPQNRPNGESVVVLSLEENLINYGVRVNFYSIQEMLCHGDGLLLISGPEEVAMKREYLPDPYLLEMQKKEPSNPFYFPFRPGVDHE